MLETFSVNQIHLTALRAVRLWFSDAIKPLSINSKKKKIAMSDQRRAGECNSP
jgi:hypothetical protein